MTPGDLYRTCRLSAYRLETLQHYEVPGDEERQSAFHAAEPLPAPRQAKLDDLQLISDLRQAGRKIGRVHVVDRPLSAYVRYELAAYAENISAGEDVRIADRSLHQDLAALTRDFAIFDRETAHPGVILFSYDPGGRLLGYEHAEDAETAGRCRRQYHLAFNRSVPLAEFMAASPGR